jgi:tetratricopeptide (TPR) repeat protein
MRVLLPFALTAALLAQRPSTFEVHLTAGQAALQQSHYADANTHLHAALTEAERPDQNLPPMRIVEAYSALCDLDFLLGRFDEAIELATRASDTTEALIKQVQQQEAPTGDGTGLKMVPDLTPHLGRLAATYRAAGKTSLAVPALERILSIDKALGENDPKVPIDYDKLASAYMELYRFDDARSAYRHALDTRIGQLGPEHIDVATSWVNLGVLEEANAKPQAARADFEQALAISGKILGVESYKLTGVLDRLGMLFSNQNLYSESEAMFQRSLTIREKVLGTRHSDVAPALENLGMVYFFDHKYIDAEPVLQRALQVYTATKPPTSPAVAQALDNLGSLYAAQKRYSDAEPFFKKALAIRETQYHESLSNLALLYDATGDMKRSDDYFQRAILVGEKGLGADHVEVLQTMDAYAAMLRKAGRIADAKKVEARLKELKGRLAPEAASGPERADAGEAPLAHKP